MRDAVRRAGGTRRALGAARTLVVTVLALAGVAGILLMRRSPDAAARMITVGSTAPDFLAKTLDSVPKTRSLADYRGQVVLLNLWASWCEPCRVEMPSIEALYRQFGPHGLKVVAVATDDPGFEDRVRSFVARYGLTFDVLSEGSGRIEQSYQSLGIPSTFLIGRDGMIRKRVTGASDWSSPANQALVSQLLGIPLPSAGGS